MTLQQLRYFCEIAAQGWNISQAAKSLHTSQPGMSRQMHALEQELGVRLFVRRRSRIVGLTGPGHAALALAQRMIGDATKMKMLGREDADETGGSLTVATTHTQARYVLPEAVKQFTRAHPGVQLYLKQGVPTELVRFVARGEADISLSAQPAQLPEDIAMLPCFRVGRIIVTPAGHPLLKARPLTLAEIARYPLITYDENFGMRGSIAATFERAGLTPKIVINAVDTEVMKTYTAAGLGVAIVSDIAFNPRHDRGLRAIPAASALLGSDQIYIGVRRHTHLRSYVHDFVRLFAPSVTAEELQRAVGLRV